MSEGFNPDYDPTGIEGGVDTNALPWMAVPKVAGMHLKPLRASTESGVFSAVVKLEAGAAMPAAVALGGMDMLVLSGAVQYAEDGATSVLEPGAWGYIPANTRITSMTARGDAEFLANFYSALAFLSEETAIASTLTSLDVLHLAQQHGVTVVPNTLAACAQKQPNSHSGKGEPLAIAARNASEIVVSGKRRAGGESKLNHPPLHRHARSALAGGRRPAGHRAEDPARQRGDGHRLDDRAPQWGGAAAQSFGRRGLHGAKWTHRLPRRAAGWLRGRRLVL